MKPRILNLGSVNIDWGYRVEHFVRPGETLAAGQPAQGAGGKGLNQSIALARAGADVLHVGRIGEDGLWLKHRLRDNGVDVTLLDLDRETPTGHAVIQITPSGENAILLHAGSNRQVSAEQIDHAIGRMSPGDHFLCQNETSGIAEALTAARARGLVVWFNPAPFDATVPDLPLHCVDWLVLNETEGAGLSGRCEPGAIITTLRERLPGTRIVLTLGKDGVICADGGQTHRATPPPVQAVDTTAAGDTFIGYLAAAVMAGRSTPDALALASRAAALSVSRPGAAESIPHRQEVA